MERLLTADPLRGQVLPCKSKLFSQPLALSKVKREQVHLQK